MTGKSNIQPAQWQQSGRYDWFLQQLIELVNFEGLNFGITLTVGGILISGTAISGPEYFKLFGEQFSGGMSNDENKEAAKGMFDMHADIYKYSARMRHKPNRVPPMFIHLKDAKFWHNSGKPLPTNQAVIWRGRLSEIDGFILGSFNNDEN